MVIVVFMDDAQTYEAKGREALARSRLTAGWDDGDPEYESAKEHLESMVNLKRQQEMLQITASITGLKQAKKAAAEAKPQKPKLEHPVFQTEPWVNQALQGRYF